MSRSPHKVRKQAEIPIADYEWLIKTHHGASISWFCTLALHSYRTVCENPKEFQGDEISPAALMLLAAKNLKEQLDEGLHQE